MEASSSPQKATVRNVISIGISKYSSFYPDLHDVERAEQDADSAYYQLNEAGFI